MRVSVRSIGRWAADLVCQPPADLLVNIIFAIDGRIHR